MRREYTALFIVVREVLQDKIPKALTTSGKKFNTDQFIKIDVTIFKNNYDETYNM